MVGEGGGGKVPAAVAAPGVPVAVAVTVVGLRPGELQHPVRGFCFLRRHVPGPERPACATSPVPGSGKGQRGGSRGLGG